MPDTTLQAFCRQLAAWIEPLILQGRHPFRKAELWPTLLTSAGAEQPPLVLWINRDSFMAGGLLFLPPAGNEADLAQACRCAEALGLSHFTLWGRDEISFWQVRNNQAHRRRNEPFGPEQGQSTRDFQGALALVLDDWKRHAIQHSLPPAQLSHHYFASLCWTTLLDSLPGLTATVQQALATTGPQSTDSRKDPVAVAKAKGFLTLLRLIAMDCFALLPPNAPPEGLERAGRFALQTLAPELADSLSARENELPLDPASAVRFNHLRRRFGQLQFNSDRRRVARTIEVLLDAAQDWLSGQPLPGIPAPIPSSRSLLLHPDRAAMSAVAGLEVASQPELAAFNLIRVLSGSPLPLQQAETPFELRPNVAPELIAGTLTDTTLPSRNELPLLGAHLRTSWPTRRFQLPPAMPRWGWELLHLLGLAAPAARIVLKLPPLREGTVFSDWFWTLLAQEATSIELLIVEHEPWTLTLVKGGPVTTPLRIIGNLGERTLASSLFHRHPSASLTMAQYLPGPLYDCLADGRLRFESGLVTETTPDLETYALSSLADSLWTLLGGAKEIPLAQKIRRGLPVPSLEILETLGAAWPAERPAPTAEEVDHTLAMWLPMSECPRREQPTSEGTPQRQRSPGSIDQTLLQQLSEEVFRDGVPLFPEHYLYAHYRPTLVEYLFIPPLRITGEFFDQFTLTDAQGHSISVTGREAAEALLLVAATGRNQVSLPAEQQLNIELVQRYRADLRRLHQNLRRLAFLQLSARPFAEKLVATVWKGKSLPPTDLFEH